MSTPLSAENPIYGPFFGVMGAASAIIFSGKPPECAPKMKKEDWNTHTHTIIIIINLPRETFPYSLSHTHTQPAILHNHRHHHLLRSWIFSGSLSRAAKQPPNAPPYKHIYPDKTASETIQLHEWTIMCMCVYDSASWLHRHLSSCLPDSSAKKKMVDNRTQRAGAGRRAQRETPLYMFCVWTDKEKKYWFWGQGLLCFYKQPERAELCVCVRVCGRVRALNSELLKPHNDRWWWCCWVIGLFNYLKYHTHYGKMQQQQ